MKSIEMNAIIMIQKITTRTKFVHSSYNKIKRFAIKTKSHNRGLCELLGLYIFFMKNLPLHDARNSLSQSFYLCDVEEFALLMTCLTVDVELLPHGIAYTF